MKKEAFIQLRIEKEVKDKAQKKADSKGLSLTEWVRSVIRLAVGRK